MMTTNKWGSLASFSLAISFFVAPLIYLMGNLRDAMGAFSYDIADFLHGPVIATSLITLTYVLREQIGERAKYRMDLALFASILAAVGLAAVAFIRASNRHYHIMHPELNLEHDVTVLTLWGTLVAGVSGLGFHFLGWNFILLGSVGWSTRIFPRLLSGLYILTGVICLFVYLSRDSDLIIPLPAIIISIWQGILLWRTEPKE